EKISENPKTDRLALLRMELHAGHVVSRGSRGECLAVSAARNEALRFVHRRVVAVDEIHVWVRRQSGPERMGREVERVPADLRNLETRHGKASHFSPEKSKPAHAGRFLALLKKHLIADADTEKRT